MSLLKAVNLAKSYKSRQVLRDLSLEVAAGEVVGLLGPNGAGKTTAFYMIVGLTRCERGQILLDDRDITDLAMHRRAQLGLGYLPQEPSVFRRLSVADNILAVLELRPGLDADARQERLEELLDELQVGHVRESLGISLSGGERRRVEIARALAAEPRFILLDEPFAALDAFTREQMQLDVQRLSDDKPRTTILVTHEIPEAVFMADKVAVMTARPSRIQELIEIDLPRPRNVATRESAAFAQYVTRIHSLFTSLGVLHG